jgi:hypothetical protein
MFFAKDLELGFALFLYSFHAELYQSRCSRDLGGI